MKIFHFTRLEKLLEPLFASKVYQHVIMCRTKDFQFRSDTGQLNLTRPMNLLTWPHSA